MPTAGSVLVSDISNRDNRVHISRYWLKLVPSIRNSSRDVDRRWMTRVKQTRKRGKGGRNSEEFTILLVLSAAE